jgi:hypothetical protein
MSRLTQNNAIRFVDELFSRINIFSEFVRNTENFKVITFSQAFSNLDTSRSSFTVNKDLGFSFQE